MRKRVGAIVGAAMATAVVAIACSDASRSVTSLQDGPSVVMALNGDTTKPEPKDKEAQEEAKKALEKEAKEAKEEAKKAEEQAKKAQEEAKKAHEKEAKLGDVKPVPLKRTIKLEHDVKWSFVAGPDGFESSNTAVGLTIWIPAGALTSTRTITVTALHGDKVAYQFGPHGLIFARDVYLTQDLAGTNAEDEKSFPIVGAYFATEELEMDGDVAVVSEILETLPNQHTKRARFPIKHFSGYLVASGRQASGRQ